MSNSSLPLSIEYEDEAVLLVASFPAEWDGMRENNEGAGDKNSRYWS